MIGPRLIAIIVSAVFGLFVITVIVTGITKARLGGQHMDQENERRPRSIAAEGDTSRSDWFRSMDRNTDGRVSREEFVGTDEQFRRLDIDANGFIIPEEARIADEWFRSQMPQ